MPLKHITETVLILVLGVVLIVTGFFLGSLPVMPQALLPWAGMFVLSLAYPLALYGLLRRHRADYWFRVLHFAPMALTLLWMAIQMVAFEFPVVLQHTVGILVVAVVLLLGALALFCLHVIRRRIKRVGSLAVLATVFVAVSMHANRTGWQRNLGASLWDGLPTLVAGMPDGYSDDGKNLRPSADPAEEAWRQKLREMAGSSKNASSRASSSRPSLIAKVQSSSSAPVIKKPNRLPRSGMGIEVITPALVAGYCGVLHRRAKRRMIA